MLTQKKIEEMWEEVGRPAPESELCDNVSRCFDASFTMDDIMRGDFLVPPFDAKKFAKEELAKAKKEKALEHRKLVVNSERKLPNFQRWKEEDKSQKSKGALKPKKEWFKKK